jgi:CoA:oxalate CoA-transferase
MQTMVHPVHRPFKMPAWPVRVDGAAVRLKASPMLGEHTDAVMSDWLGLNGAAVTALRQEGVLG